MNEPNRALLRAKKQQMDIFCRTKSCEKCELYTAINARYADD